VLFRARVARFVNAYPNMEVEYKLEDLGDLTAGEPISMAVTLTRDIDEQDEVEQVADAARYAGKKLVNWWLVVGDHASRSLYGIKKVTVKESLTTKLSFTLPQGSHRLKLYLICDSYIGMSRQCVFGPSPSTQLTIAVFHRRRPRFRFGRVDRCSG
jgi:pre-mRNA-splicing helicase BRR2